MRTVLVAGGAGYVGSHTCKALAAAGYLPVSYDNLSTGFAELVKWGPLVRGELADTAAVRAALREHRCEAVLHFAASAYVGESVTAPRKYANNNVGASLSLLDAMLDEGCKTVVLSSTCAVYGCPATMPIVETTPLAPVNPYGQSKRYLEEVLGAYGTAYGLRWMALRYFNAAGGDPDGDTGELHEPETHLVPLAIRAALGGAPISVFGTDYPTRDGTCVRDYVHVGDLARAHVAALGHLEKGNESRAVNLGTGTGSSVTEVLDAVGRVTHATVPRTLGPRRPGDPPTLVADASLARSLLGWQPERSLEDVVRTAVCWARSREDLCPEGELLDTGGNRMEVGRGVGSSS